MRALEATPQGMDARRARHWAWRRGYGDLRQGAYSAKLAADFCEDCAFNAVLTEAVLAGYEQAQRDWDLEQEIKASYSS